MFLSTLTTLGSCIANNATSKDAPLQELLKAYREAYYAYSIAHEETQRRWDNYSERSSQIGEAAVKNFRNQVGIIIEKVKLRRPYNYRLFWMQAYLLRHERQFKESIAYYTLAINYAQEHEYALNIAQLIGNRTLCQFRMENPTENFGGFRDNMWIKSIFCAYDVYTSDRTRYHHMVEYIDAKKYEQAIEIGMSILEHDPYSSHVNEAIGYAYYCLQDYEKAIEYCECGLLCAVHDPRIRQPMWYVLAESHGKLSNDVETKYRKLLVEAANALVEQVKDRYDPHQALKRVMRMAHTRLLPKLSDYE
jgi:tetratricopeptide (TPR) repeat protein